MCPMDKSGWGYFSIFWRPGRTHGTPEGGLEEEPSAWHVWLACVFKAFSKRLQSVFKASSKRLQSAFNASYTPDYSQTTVGPKMHFGEENLLAPDKSMGVIWTPPTAELSQKMFLRQPVQGNDRAQTVRNPYRRAIGMYDWHVIGMWSACDYEVKGGLQRTGLLTSADAAVDRRHFAGWGSAP